MNKHYWNYIFKKWFNLSNNSKILYYRNPKDCSRFNNGFEKHKFFHDYTENVIYGYRKRKDCKSPIKIGKIITPNVVLFLNNIYDKIIYYIVNLLENPLLFLGMYYLFISFIFICLLFNMSVIEGLIHAKRNLI